MIEIAPGTMRPIAIVDRQRVAIAWAPGAVRRQGAEGGSGQTNGENSARPPINVDRVGLLLRRAPPFVCARIGRTIAELRAQAIRSDPFFELVASVMAALRGQRLRSRP